MVAVIFERCNVSIKECFGVNSVYELPFFDTTLERILKNQNIFSNARAIFRIPDNTSELNLQEEVKNLISILEKNPSDTVILTYSDVYLSDADIFEIKENERDNLLFLSNKNEKVLCTVSACDYLKFVRENYEKLEAVFSLIKESKAFDGYVKIIDSPLKYKEFCNDMLLGKISYRLPEIAQGIYASLNIPAGDFVLIPPVYFGRDVQVEKGCVVGPYTIINDGVLIAENSRVSNSFLGENTYISTDCCIEGALLGNDVVLRRESVVFGGSVLCHDAWVNEGSVVENGSFIRAFSKVYEHNKNYQDFRFADSEAESGFYGFLPEKAAQLGAGLGVVFDMPKIAVACDGELNSVALKLALLGGLITTGAHCFDFGNTFLSSLHYYMDFCELDYGVYVDGNDDGTVISVFRKGSTTLTKSEFYNIKSVLSNEHIGRCSKNQCKNVRQIHGMQRMYIQKLTGIFDEGLNFMPVFNCENKRILSTVELAVSKIGFKTGRKRVEFNINSSGSNASVKSDGVEYTYSKLIDIISYYQRKDDGFYINDIYKRDSVFLCFYIMKILSLENKDLSSIVSKLPQFYVVTGELEGKCDLRVLAADLSKNNKIIFKKDEISYSEGFNKVRIKKCNEGVFNIKAQSQSMETAREIVENLKHRICNF